MRTRYVSTLVLALLVGTMLWSPADHARASSAGEPGTGGLTFTGDLDGDGIDDVIETWPDGFDAVSGSDGTTMWSWTPIRNPAHDEYLRHWIAPGGQIDQLGGSGEDLIMLEASWRCPPEIGCLAAEGEWILSGIRGSDGGVLWQYRFSGAGAALLFVDAVRPYAPTSDLDGDGARDILARVGHDVNGYRVITALSGRTGTPIATYHPGDLARVITDATGDGLDDVLTAVWHASTNTYDLRLWRSDGTLVWLRSIQSMWFGRLAAMDATGNGTADLVFPTIVGVDEDLLVALSGLDGSTMWTTSIRQGPAPVEAGDVAGDGGSDVLTEYWGGSPRVLRGTDGTELWADSIDNKTGTAVHTVGDVTGDGIVDLTYIDPSDDRVLVSGYDGTIVWVRDDPASLTPLGGDVDGDGADDLIGRITSTIWTVSGSTGALIWTLETPSADLVSFSLAGTAGLVGVADSVNGRWIEARDPATTALRWRRGEIT